MLIFFQELCLQLFLWILKLVDGLMEIFSAISGIAKVNYHGQEVNLIELIVGDNTIAQIFWCIFILAVGLTCIFAIVAVIKNMVANNRNLSTIIGKFFLSLLGTMAMLAVVVLVILISNSVLQMLAQIFQIGNTTKLSNAIFNACVGDWINGYSAAQIDVTSLSVRDIFGDYNAALFGVWPTSWKCNGIVNPNTFMYLPSLIASVALVIALLVAVINLAKRVYEILFLYFTMPISMSTLAVDDGARFKNWRELFITKIVLAFGAVMSVNVFALILPLVQAVSISGVSKFGNAIFLLFMIVGGALVIPAGQSLFARLFGQADDMHAGGGFLRNAFYGGRIVGGMTIGLAAKGIKGITHIIHSRKKDGKDEKSSAASDSTDDDKYSEEGETSEETESE